MPIVSDVYNRHAQEVAALLHQRLADHPLPPHLFVVLGGDGFMLKTVAQETDPDAVFLGLNCGRVGFLLNDLPDRLEEVPALLAGRLSVHSFPRIVMEAVTQDGAPVLADAINDIYLERATGQTAHLRVTINGATIVERLVADGLIVSTALGSTAYAFSAGASACHPALPVIGVTPICPHAPMLRPLVFPLDAVIDVHVISAARRPVRAVSDGFEHGPVKDIRIRDAGRPVKFAFLPSHDFTHTLVRKLLT